MRRAWIAVAVGMALRFLSVPWARDLVLWDAISYKALALSLARGEGYGVAGHATAFWVPGWAAWMSIFYRLGLGDAAVATGNVLLGGVTIGTTFLLGRDLGGRSAGAWAAAAVALLPSLILLPGLLLSENLAIPLTVLAVWLVVRADRSGTSTAWAAAALACAAATLVREACVAVAAAAAFVAAGHARVAGPKALAMFAVVFCLGVTPWVLRNRSALAITTLTTSASVNLCIGLGAGATGGYRLMPWFQNASEIEADGAIEARARECVRDGLSRRPLSVVTLAPAKLSRLLTFDDWEVDEFFAQRAPRGLAWALEAGCDLGYWALWAAAAIGVLRRGAGRVVLVTVSAFALLTVATFGVARFHAVWLPLLAALAGANRPTAVPSPRSPAGVAGAARRRWL